jgi:hypothetical protein
MNNVHRQVGNLLEFTPGNDTARAQLDAEIQRLRKALRGIMLADIPTGKDPDPYLRKLACEALGNETTGKSVDPK